MDYCQTSLCPVFSDDKPNTNALYIRQPCALQVIQLVECSPPPRQPYTPSRISSYVDSSDASSSSSSSAPMSSSPDEDESESESPESYCSSDAASSPLAPSPPASRDPTVDDTFRIRMKRIHAWRDTLHPERQSSTYSGSPFCLPAFSCYFRFFVQKSHPFVHRANASSPVAHLSETKIRTTSQTLSTLR